METNKKELISNYLDGELNAEDTQTAELLITEDMEVRKLYEEIKSIDTLIDTLPVLSPTEEMRYSFMQKLAKERFNRSKERKLQKVLLFSSRFAIAASIMLLVSLAVFFVFKLNKTETQEIQPPTTATNTGDFGKSTSKPDEEMYEYMEVLSSVYDLEVLANIEESTFESLENKEELSFVDAALATQYGNFDYSSND